MWAPLEGLLKPAHVKQPWRVRKASAWISGTVANATVSANRVTNALYNGVGFSTSMGIVLENNAIQAPGLDGIVIGPARFEALTGSATLTGNTVLGLNSGESAFVNLSSGYTVTRSGNNF